MDILFIKIFNMSISAAWVVLAVAAVRLLMRKMPKRLRVLLWAVVGLRLVMPFSIESALSLIPSVQTVPETIIYSSSPAIKSGIPALNSSINPVISAALSPDTGDSANPMQVITAAAGAVWLIGVAAMLIYAAVSYGVIKRKVRVSVCLQDNIYLCDGIASPFIIGIFKPEICIPSAVNGEDMQFVIAHEKAHLKRRDHWWKPLGFLLLSVHWFNPVLWIAYILLCKDIELACDEKVIKEMGAEIKKDYSNALINCSVSGKKVAACPLAFGETDIKGRIKSVLSYKKPAVWAVAAAVTVSVALAVCFLTDPEQEHGFFGAKYETAECIYSYVISEDKASRTNPVHYAVNSDGSAYITYDGSEGEYIGTLSETDFSAEQLNGLLSGQGESGVLIGKIESAYAIINRQGVREYLFLQNTQGDYFAVSFFSDGGIMDIFRLAKEEYGTQSEKKNALTLETVVRLSQKGQKLGWADFEKFDYTETGSGLYIRKYEIDSMFSLMIGGGSTETKPMYIYLHASDETDAVTDIRDGTVQEFIDAHRSNPVVTQLSAAWHCCPVGYNEEAISYMIEAGGIPYGAVYDRIKALPALKIESTHELDEFRNKMSFVMNFGWEYPDSPSFNSVSGEFGEEFFEKSSLIAVYTAAPSTSRRHTLEILSVSQGVLSIGISEIDGETGDTAMEGWLILISVEKAELTTAREIRCFVSSTQKAEIPEGNARIYVFEEAEDIIKPSVALYDSGRFQFNFSALSSYVGMGEYTAVNGTVTLRTDDGKFEYVFEIRPKEQGDPNFTPEGKKLVFDAQKSSDMLWYSGMYDGCEFY